MEEGVPDWLVKILAQSLDSYEDFKEVVLSLEQDDKMSLKKLQMGLADNSYLSKEEKEKIRAYLRLIR